MSEDSVPSLLFSSEQAVLLWTSHSVLLSELSSERERMIRDFTNFHYANIMYYQKKYLNLEKQWSGVIVHLISVDTVRKQLFMSKLGYSQAAFLKAGQMAPWPSKGKGEKPSLLPLLILPLHHLNTDKE